MNWIKYNGENVKVGEKVLCALQHWHTKNYRYAELKKVDEDDVDFRFVDDNSEPSYDWNVTHFAKIEAPE